MKIRGYIDPIPSILPWPSKPFVVGEPMFLSEVPELCFVDGGDRGKIAITLGDVVYRNRRGYVRRVPSGLPFDGASYPWFAGWIWDRWDPGDLQAVILHDFTYAAFDSVRSWPVGRREADQDLLDGFRLNPETHGDRIRYIAVRLGAFGIWRRQSKCEWQRRYFEALEMGPEMLKRWVDVQIKKGKTE